MSEAQPSPLADQVRRLFPPDGLRGLIMVLMALDHASHFVAHKHVAAENWGGPFPVYYDALAFLTRAVTHLAAPGFFFLMGVGMMLLAHSQRQRGWSAWATARYFLIRGAVLLAVKFLVVNRAWELSPGGWGLSFYFGVLAALGGCMILASALVRLKPWHLLALSLALFVGAELLTPDPARWGPNFSLPVSMLLIPGGGQGWWVNYPILQWLELVVFGLAVGGWLSEDPRRGYRRTLGLGVAFLLAFAVIRALDGFGNIRPRMGNDWTDFLNPVKYPPSMAFTLMTTGVNLILLWLFSLVGERTQRLFWPLTVFGKVPLFFYVLHLFLYAGLGYLLTPQGTSLVAMYPLWLLGLLILFPLCWAYGRFRAGQPANSVVRFF